MILSTFAREPLVMTVKLNRNRSKLPARRLIVYIILLIVLLVLIALIRRNFFW